MTREQAIRFLTDHPVKFANLLGFKEMGELHNYWVRKMILNEDDETLQASRATYKTTSVSIALALIIILLPSKRTLFARKTDNDVKEIITQVQKILNDERTKYFVRIIYGVELKLTKETAMEVSTNLVADIKGTHQLVGIGIGSSLTGKHFDYIFTDDIININDRISKTERDKTKLIYQELQNIKTRDGKIFNTGTPWHKDDAFSIMPKAERYDCYHPEIKKIISAEKLAELKKSMIPSLFAANYELRHIASEDVIFANPQFTDDDSLVEQAKFDHIDASYGGADYTAYTIMNKKNGKYYVYGKMWHKHVDDCLDDIIRCHHRFMVGSFMMETNSDKGYLAKELKQKGERVSTYHESMNKYLKIVTYLKKIWDDVIFVKGTDKEYVQMILDYNVNAEHDDAPDSLASISRKLWKRKDNEVDYEDEEMYNVYLW